MPQLSQIGEIYASQLFWLAIVFALIYFGIGKAMVPKIEKTVDDRNARISGDIAAAEAARKVVVDSAERYQTDLDVARAKALKSLTEAKSAAAINAEVAVKAGDAAAAARVAEATDRVAAAKTSAMSEIESATVEAVESIIAKLSGVTADRSAIEQQVKAELAHG